jgi:hypothetical protein
MRGEVAIDIHNEHRLPLHERGLLPCRVLVPLGLGIGRRGVRGVGAPLAPAAKPGVARIVGGNGGGSLQGIGDLAAER